MLIQPTISRRLVAGFAAAYLLMVIAAFLPVTAAAVEMDDLYTARVPIDPQHPDNRDKAYRDALKQILVRITGSESAALAPELNGLFPSPARYVLQYRPGEDNTLVVAMDGPAIEQLVRQAGFPVWGSDRPLTVVWLAVDWGQGDRELVGANDGAQVAGAQPAAGPMSREAALREQMQAVARARGVPIVFPLLDARDVEQVSGSDVWGGFHDRLLQASRRYGARAVLVGRVRPGLAEQNRWSFYYGQRRQQWNGDVDEAMHLLADTLAGQLAQAGSAPLQQVLLSVSGVTSVRAYGEVTQIIASLSTIDHYTVDSVAGDRVRYRIDINGGSERLQSALEFNGKLTPAGGLPAMVDGPAAASTPTLDYVYNP